MKLTAWLKPTGAYFKPGADKGALPAFFTGGGDGDSRLPPSPPVASNTRIFQADSEYNTYRNDHYPQWELVDYASCRPGSYSLAGKQQD